MSDEQAQKVRETHETSSRLPWNKPQVKELKLSNDTQGGIFVLSPDNPTASGTVS